MRLSPQPSLRALVVIANPANVAEYEPGGRALTQIDVAGELKRVKPFLRDMEVTALQSRGRATLNNLLKHLRDGYDILYLVCHRALIEGEPRLWLENEDGLAYVIAGNELITRLMQLGKPVRLAILASFQGAGRGDDIVAGGEDALTSLGPGLLQAGIHAVLAMQSHISIETIETFMSVFFRELKRDGQIDRAIAFARSTVRDRPDWWVPVLFTRLKSGRIWYMPGFVKADSQQKFWSALGHNILDEACTPLLGPGVNELFFGYSQLERPGRDLRQELLGRYGAKLPADAEKWSLEELITAVWPFHQERYTWDPNVVLAQLPFSIYVTTNPENLLVQVLQRFGKAPKVEVCRWNTRQTPIPSIYEAEPDYQPSVARPLVYHLFGSFAVPHSIVLPVEDDYYNFMAGFTRNPDMIPPVVRAVLANTTLLLLGFEVDTTHFRTLSSIILSIVGSPPRGDYVHVLQHRSLEEGFLKDFEHAQRYVEDIVKGLPIKIYWGNPWDFTQELLYRVEEMKTFKASSPRTTPEPARETAAPSPSAVEGPLSNPYVGPRPFKFGEVIFGRNKEVTGLTDLLLAGRIVMLYGPHGAGKTSLIQAGLVPRLQQEGFKVLPAVRIGLEPPPGLTSNRFILSLLLCLEQSLPEEQKVAPTDLAKLTLSEYLSQRWPKDKVVLIFDQFEEILLLDQGDTAAKRNFFKELGITLRDSQCRVLFAVREKFVTVLELYLSNLPTQVAPYRLGFLDARAAIEVIQQTARQAGVDFTQAVAAGLVDELRKVRIVNERGESREILSEYVEPMMLQVVCRHIWENLSSNATQIDTDDIKVGGDIDGILGRYYADAVLQAASQTGVPERAIREWCEDGLISLAGTRRP